MELKKAALRVFLFALLPLAAAAQGVRAEEVDCEKALLSPGKTLEARF